MSRILGDAALFYAKGDWRMNAKRKIIIDCDTGIDDALALMLALASPELEVIGITDRKSVV